MSTELSFIIINYNTKDLLFNCLNSISVSIEKMSDLVYEIIVVDNASIDGSVEMVKDKFPTVKIIQNSTNKGYAYAVNKGIKFAMGEYLFLLNSDIILIHNSLNPLLNYMKENLKTGIVGPQLIYPNGVLQRSYGHIPSLIEIILNFLFINFISDKVKVLLWKLGYNFDKTPKIVGYIDGASMLIRRKLVQEIGYFDEKFFFYAEDVDFCFRGHKMKWEVMFIPQSQVIHLRGASSIKKDKISFNIQLVKANLQFLAKHYNKVNVLIYRVLAFIHFLVRFIKNGIQLIFLIIFVKKNKINLQLKKLKVLKEMINFTLGVDHKAVRKK